jgi:glycyl-tRNA synthetase (class II)
MNKNDLAHYARACTDIVFKFPFGKEPLTWASPFLILPCMHNNDLSHYARGCTDMAHYARDIVFKFPFGKKPLI